MLEAGSLLGRHNKRIVATALCASLCCCSAGFTSAITRASLDALAAGDGAGVRQELPDWPTLQQQLAQQGGSLQPPPAPFLFIGTVLDAPAATVYALSEPGQGVVGVAVSSEAAC